MTHHVTQVPSSRYRRMSNDCLLEPSILSSPILSTQGFGCLTARRSWHDIDGHGEGRLRPHKAIPSHPPLLFDPLFLLIFTNYVSSPRKTMSSPPGPSFCRPRAHGVYKQLIPQQHNTPPRPTTIRTSGALTDALILAQVRTAHCTLGVREIFC
jgi:hypothetical protein